MDPPATATTYGARDHARAQGGTRVRGMPTLPVSTAVDLPAGVGTGDLIWDEVLEAGDYSAHRVPRGVTVRLADLEGDGCAHVAIHHADLPSERLSLADTTKVQWQMYPSAGSVLLSDRGRVLMAIEGDTSGRHDTICSAPNRAAHDAKYGDGRVEGRYPNARDRLIVALAKFGLGRQDLHPTASFFKGVRVEADGTLRLDPVPGQPGTHVDLRAELDVFFSVANVPHVLDQRTDYCCTAVRVTAWRGVPRSPGHPRGTPEQQRAYDNTDDWLLGAGQP
jgi:urea carboxylase-associated protein 2